MVKFNYGKTKGLAVKLLDKFAGSGALLRYPNFSEEQVRMLVLDYTTRQVDGTRILLGDKRLLISPVSLSGRQVDLPQAEQDRVKTPDGKVYEIISCMETSPDGQTTLLYEIQARA